MSSNDSNDSAQALAGQGSETASTETIQVTQEQQRETLPTVEELRRIAREEARAALQSSTDKIEARFTKQIQQQFAALDSTKKVLGLTDAQVAEARTKIVNDVYAQGAAQASDAPPDEDEIPAEVMAKLQPAIDWMREQQVEITEDDPEYQKFLEPVINKNGFTAAHFALAMRDAVEAYKARKARQRGNPETRVPTGPGGAASAGDISGITDSKELYKLGEAQLRRSKT